MQSAQRLDRYARLIEPFVAVTGGVDSELTDSTAHTRRVYPPLILYSRLLAMESSGRTDFALAEKIHTLQPGIWSALARRVGGELFGKPGWIESARVEFEQLIARQQPSGEFLATDSHANPETRWYEELTLLHAVASYSIREPGSTIQAAISRAAFFHLNETQPDHATAEPWALLAFVQYAPPLADQVLHAMAMQYPQGVTGAALLLLGDALYGLRRLSRKGA